MLLTKALNNMFKGGARPFSKAIGAASKTPLKERSVSSIVLGTKRGRSLIGAAGLYGVGNVLISEQSNYMRAYVGESEYGGRYAAGEQSARTAVTLGAAYQGFFGGILGKSPIIGTAKLPYKAVSGLVKGHKSRQVFRSLRDISPYPESTKKAIRWNRARSKLLTKSYNRSGVFGGRPMKLGKPIKDLASIAAKGRWTYAGIGMFGLGTAAGLSFTPSYRNTTEGKITALGQMKSGRLNYNTAGLTQALHQRNKR